MKIIRCKKCGSPVCTDEAIIERMSDTIQELHEKSRHSKGLKSQSYLAEAAAVKKILVQIIHCTSQIEERKETKTAELGEIVHYLRAHKLITDDKLDELKEIARQKVKAWNKADENHIKELYGEYKSHYVSYNNTKADPTANKAIKNVER